MQKVPFREDQEDNFNDKLRTPKPFYSITLVVEDYGEYVGNGCNKKIAKVAAVKQFFKTNGSFLINDRNFFNL